MKRYILTGTPGAGKTSVLRLLERLGYCVVEEAATDVIALGHALGEDELWRRPSFIDQIVDLQRQRQVRSLVTGMGVQFYDRSPICTHALSVHLGQQVSAPLAAELDRIAREGSYQRRVFFIRNLGFCTPTAARRITFADSLAFERIHEQSYRAFGYELVDVPPGPLAERAAAIREVVDRDAGRPAKVGTEMP
jgi:predicted ATPase